MVAGVAGVSPDERVRLVNRLAERLVESESDIANLIAGETGKPLQFSRREVQGGTRMLRAIAARYQATPDEEPAGSAIVRRRPLGTVAVITPANNPIYIPLGKIIPAFLYGNVVIWKPAPEAQSVSRKLMSLLADAGWPDGVVNLRPGGRSEAESLMKDPVVAAVTITGSESAGRAAREICARRNVRLQAELGGNNAAIVCPDADLADAANRIAAGAFEMAGQRCTANRRVIVFEECRNAFLDLLVLASKRLTWGDPLSLRTDIGPLVSRARRERVAAVVERAASECGATIQPLGNAVAGFSEPPMERDDGGRSSLRFAGCWFPPTILCCDDPTQEIVQEETFGPVLVLQSAQNRAHAIELCNGVRQGLVAAVFTRSRETVDLFLREAEAGMLKVNQTTSDAEVDVPFCAWKASGTGVPKHGNFSRDFYTRAQTVYGLDRVQSVS